MYLLSKTMFRKDFQELQEKWLYIFLVDLKFYYICMSRSGSVPSWTTAGTGAWTGAFLFLKAQSLAWIFYSILFFQLFFREIIFE